MTGRSPLGFLVLAACVLTGPAPSQEVLDAAAAKRVRLKDDAADFWIYDDLAEGNKRAAASGKPLLISFRCVP